MQKKPLVIAVYDPRWFLRVLEILRRRGVSYHHYYTPHEVPLGSIVYTDYKPIAEELLWRKDLLVVYDSGRTCRLLEKAISMAYLKERYKSIVVGVDPGRVLSYVVVGDSELLMYGSGTVEHLSKDIDYVVNCLDYDELLVRVGTGIMSEEIILAIKGRFSVPIELVDESYTTPSMRRIHEIEVVSKRLRGIKPFRQKDVYAAFRIALSKGIEVV